MAAVTMSPSDPEHSSASATTGPRGASSGYVDGASPRGDIPADDAAGQLLHDELRGVAAGVAADVDDERVAQHLAAQVAVEVRPALADHVGHVQVADLAAAELTYRSALAADPVLVAQPPVAAERHHHDAAAPAAVRPRRPRARPACPPCRPAAGPVRPASTAPAVDREQQVAGPRRRRPGAASGERARGSEVSPCTHPGDPPAVAVRSRSAPSRPAPAAGAGPPPGGDHVGVRGAELAEYLPEHVGELGPGGDPVQQRPVLRCDGVPVDVGHVGRPRSRAA